MASYRTSDGDMLDRICWKYYGFDNAGVVELVLDHNTGLASLGEVYPAGLVIDLPEIEQSAKTSTEIDEAAALWA